MRGNRVLLSSLGKTQRAEVVSLKNSLREHSIGLNPNRSIKSQTRKINKARVNEISELWKDISWRKAFVTKTFVSLLVYNVSLYTWPIYFKQ